MLNIYDHATLEKVAVLQNAFDIIEDEQLNAVSELRFSMPTMDEKNAFCQPFAYVRWNDNGALYRILDSTTETGDDVGAITYYAEHVIGTLIDTVIFGTLQLDNWTTRQVLERVLELQNRRDWQLGDCEYERWFSYAWSHENLITALYGVPNRFDTLYKWEFDTSSYPWTIHLRRLDESIDPEYYIRDGRNLMQSTFSRKGRDICNRIYALGYGEGINQLTIRDINDGLPYVENAESIGKYGLIERIWEDGRFEVPENLMERARVLLEGYAVPFDTLTVGVADLEKSTGEEYDRAAVGKIVDVDGYRSYIRRVERHLDAVGQDVIEIANAPADIAGSIAEQADRARINRVYAQGNTVPFNTAFADNADAAHPLVVEVYIPDEARVVNKVIIAWRMESFRAYETGASAGGGTATSTSSGGGQTTSSGGGTSTSTESGGGSTRTSGSSSSSTTANGGSANLTTTTLSNASYADGQTAGSNVAGVAAHSHAYQYISNHAHPITLPSHSHGMSHTHSIDIPAHSHSFSVPAHTHGTQAHTHGIDLPNHTHAILYGIYEGPRASGVQMRVDGAAVSVDGTQMDVTQYLSVDDAGKIRRGTFHRIELIPNSLTRIAGTVYAQMFIQSEGGVVM